MPKDPHEFVGAVLEEHVWDVEHHLILQMAGDPVVAQVRGASKGALAQVCAVCGRTANEDGTTKDH